MHKLWITIPLRRNAGESALAMLHIWLQTSEINDFGIVKLAKPPRSLDRTNRAPHSSHMINFEILQTSGAASSPLGSPRLAVGIRDRMSTGDGTWFRVDRLEERCGTVLWHRLPLTNCPRPNTTPTQRPAVPRAEHQRSIIFNTACVRPEESAPLLSRRVQSWRTHENLLGLHHVEQVATAVCRLLQQTALSCVPAQKQTLS